MFGQHVINHRAILVALRTPVGFDHRIDRVHELGALCKAQLLLEEVFFHCLKFAGLRGRNRGGVCVLYCRATADRHFGQKCHIWRHATFVDEIFRILRNEIVPFSHTLTPDTEVVQPDTKPVKT